MIASRLGAYAVDLLAQEISGVAVGLKGEDLIYVPVEEAMKSPIDPAIVSEMANLIGTLSGI